MNEIATLNIFWAQNCIVLILNHDGANKLLEPINKQNYIKIDVVDVQVLHSVHDGQHKYWRTLRKSEPVYRARGFPSQQVWHSTP